MLSPKIYWHFPRNILIVIVPNQLLGLLRASLQRAKRWGAWKCWKRLLALPGEHISSWYFQQSKLWHRPWRTYRMASWIFFSSSSSTSSESSSLRGSATRWLDSTSSRLSAIFRRNMEWCWQSHRFYLPKNQRVWPPCSSGVPYHPQLLCDHCCLRPRPDLQVQLGSWRWIWQSLIRNEDKILRTQLHSNFIWAPMLMSITDFINIWCHQHRFSSMFDVTITDFLRCFM